MRTELTIVVPVIDSNKHLLVELSQVGQSLIKSSISAEIVIISSTDSLHLHQHEYEALSTRSLLRIRAFTSTQVKGQKRLGQLLRLGSSLADSRFVFFLIPEGKFDSTFLAKALSCCRSGSALVIANRFNTSNLNKYGARKAFAQQAIFRNIFRVFGLHLPPDITNSTRMFDKRVFDALAISGVGWDMLAEHTIKTKLINESIHVIEAEIPSFKRIGDFRISLHKRFFGITRIATRTILHKLGLLWY